MNQFYLGLDLGQRQDYTAIAVVERDEPVFIRFDYVDWLRKKTKIETRFVVRYLDRVALGTSYVSIVERVRRMVKSEELRGRCSVVVDGTGVGGAVVDLLRDSDMDCELVPVQITGGSKARREAGAWNVPKRELISVVQVLFEQGRLVFADGMPRMGTLLDELMAMRVRVTTEGNERYGAWREGAHDDLALAVAMACWMARWDEEGVGERAEGRVLSF
jgi:hypothetical protein